MLHPVALNLAAQVVIDPQSGAIRAIIGDRSPTFAGFNRAVDAKRPIGSLIKPVVVDQQSLIKLTGLPLLGTVTLIPTPEQKKSDAMGLVVFSSLAAVLVVAFVGINIGQVLALS